MNEQNKVSLSPNNDKAIPFVRFQKRISTLTRHHAVPRLSTIRTTHPQHLCIMSRRFHPSRRKKVGLLDLPCIVLTLNSARLHLAVKMADEYKHYRDLPPALLAQQGAVGPARPTSQKLLTAGRTSPRVLSAPPLTPSTSIDRHLAHDRHHRQHTQSTTLDIRHLGQALRSTRPPQDDAYRQTDLPPTLETRPRHLGPSGLGPQRRRRAWKHVVCHRRWGPRH